MTGEPLMSETEPAGAAAAQDMVTPVGPSAGKLLRAAREAAGLHIGALAVSLKVPVKKLEALESDDLAQLPDAVFARALAASVCRTLKIDPEPILQKLPQLHATPLPLGGPGEEVRLDSHRGLRMSASFGLPKPVLLLTAALLIGAGVVLMLPSLRGAGEPAAVSTDRAVTPVTVDPALLSPPSVPASDGATSLSAGTTATALAGAASAAVTATPAAIAPVAASSAATPMAPVASEPAALVIFSTRAPAWVQVQGADGVVHLRKTMDGGESVRINGALPLSVVIGRADAIDVQVRGKPFDLAPLTKDNVARFQIK
jgi:cytoskeleton protein RodZ